MNEKIKSLAEKANWYKPTGLPSDWDDEDYIVGPADMEKFAELIVRECVEVCFAVHNAHDGDYVLAKWCAEGIQKHFGVEE